MNGLVVVSRTMGLNDDRPKIMKGVRRVGVFLGVFTGDGWMSRFPTRTLLACCLTDRAT